MALCSGTIWVAVLLILWLIFLITVLVTQLSQPFYAGLFPSLYLAWILTLLIPVLRRAMFLQNITVFATIFFLVWISLYQLQVYPVTTPECGSTVCQGSYAANPFYNPLSSRAVLTDPLVHRGICPGDTCRWASDNGLPNLGYDRDIDGFLNYDSPDGPYASVRPQDLQNNLGKCFRDGFVEGITVITEFVYAPGVSTEFDGQRIGNGLRICTHCSNYIYGDVDGCASNGLEAICVLCPKPAFSVTFWVSWLAIWSVATLLTYLISDDSYPECCERRRAKGA